ncbi:hypothetical protein [Mucilaginibacter sp. CSA2-8R]|uniref:hypothetical protein n=1 Tax=Mucilaginibacter sp. CSA2-8R TaxID=3141542 RepID=UPI00315CDA9A
MRNYRTPSVSKMVKRFDSELKALLLEDLKAVKNAKNKIIDSITQTMQTPSFNAA